MESRKVAIIPLDETSKGLSQVLANDTSRRVLDLVSEEPMSAMKVAYRLNIGINTAQYNLEKLEGVGMLEILRVDKSRKGRDVKVYAPTNRIIAIVPRNMDIGGLREAFRSILPLIIAALVFSIGVEMFAYPQGPGYADYGSGGLAMDAKASYGGARAAAPAPMAAYAGGERAEDIMLAASANGTQIADEITAPSAATGGGEGNADDAGNLLAPPLLQGTNMSNGSLAGAGNAAANEANGGAEARMPYGEGQFEAADAQAYGPDYGQPYAMPAQYGPQSLLGHPGLWTLLGGLIVVIAFAAMRRKNFKKAR